MKASFRIRAAVFCAAVFLLTGCKQPASDEDAQPPEEMPITPVIAEPPAEAIAISSAADLLKIDAANTALSYYLANDITLDDWAPISSEKPFKGSFYGKGNTITITNGEGGLFDSLSGATVRDINVKVTASATSGNIGGIAAYAEQSRIINCKADVTLTVNGTNHNASVGGIIGTMGKNSTVSYCAASGKITLDSDTESGFMVYAGGIAGYSGTPGLAGNGASGCVIENSSWSSGEVAATGGYPYAGGIVGYNYTGAVVRRCSARGSSVSSYGGNLPYAGGVAGYNSGYGGKPSTIENCYSTAAVTAKSSSKAALAGGIAGANAAGALISKCLARGAVTAWVVGNGTDNIGGSTGMLTTANAGGIAGAQYFTLTTKPTITACAALNSSITGREDTGSGSEWNVYRIAGAGSEGDDTGVFTNNIAYSGITVTNHAASWLKTDGGNDGTDCVEKPGQTAYSGMGWDFSGVWRMDDGYPVLRDGL
jgi:hypothetical protein